MSFDLTDKNIKDTFQNLLQKTGSEGRLYDLEGNQVRDLTIDGTLTANTYITSESITATSSGSTAFGNSADDTHTFQGNITASGNISSSGGFVGPTLYGSSDTSTDYIHFSNAFDTIYVISQDINLKPFNGVSIGHIITYNPTAKLDVNGNIFTNSHITASGNISASATSTGSFGNLEVDGDISASGDLFLDGASSNFIYSDGIKANVDNDVNISMGTGGITFMAEAGDNFIFNEGENNVDLLYYNSDEATMVYFDASTSRVGIGEDISQTPAKTLTVKGDISASGTIYVDGLDIQSHITASGDISSSGTITAEHIVSSDDMVITANLDIGTSITHHGDGDTKIQFTTDNIVLTAGNENLLTLSEGAQDKVMIGDGGDVDLQVKSNGDDNALFVQGSSDNVGIGISTPTKKLQVEGDISASGGFFVSSSGNTMINSDLTGSMATHLGAFSVNYGDATQLTGSLTAAGKGYGDIVKFGGTTGMTPGAIYYLRSNVSWFLADGTGGNAAAACSSSLLGVAMGGNSDVDGVLLRGFVEAANVDSNVVGQKLYVFAHPGGKFGGATPGTSGNIVRVAGYSLTNGAEVYFNPDNTWVEVS